MGGRGRSDGLRSAFRRRVVSFLYFPAFTYFLRQSVSVGERSWESRAGRQFENPATKSTAENNNKSCFCFEITSQQKHDEITVKIQTPNI